jgi:prevent-host-death family protein
MMTMRMAPPVAGKAAMKPAKVKRTAGMPDRRKLEMDQTMVHFVLRIQGSKAMEISVTDAKAQLTDLVRRAEAGEDVFLTRHGQAVARIVAAPTATTRERRRQLLVEIMESARGKATPGPDAARSQDFLYGDDGLPE